MPQTNALKLALEALTLAVECGGETDRGKRPPKSPCMTQADTH